MHGAVTAVLGHDSPTGAFQRCHSLSHGITPSCSAGLVLTIHPPAINMQGLFLYYQVCGSQIFPDPVTYVQSCVIVCSISLIAPALFAKTKSGSKN